MNAINAQLPGQFCFEYDDFHELEFACNHKYHSFILGLLLLIARLLALLVSFHSSKGPNPQTVMATICSKSPHVWQKQA